MRVDTGVAEELVKRRFANQLNVSVRLNRHTHDDALKEDLRSQLFPGDHTRCACKFPEGSLEHNWFPCAERVLPDRSDSRDEHGDLHLARSILEENCSSEPGSVGHQVAKQLTFEF